MAGSSSTEDRQPVGPYRLLSCLGTGGMGRWPTPLCGARAGWHMSTERGESSDRVPAPVRIGPYRILSPLGEGGLGMVYLAE